ncbi:unnamed protein product [Kluyveromyces dobzhanskii CBS 2104]|uniref:WGS project CCBQ000000000 data, contig 00106 n=1 Tax=Kluyveromyces dobzhanskii CBS 2104 TaxID=1427455 RepID=A0A0A8L5H5_9SACH|nr:unnamed protein product [Kluyveromyces dobzhanskii CBS 2104]
MSDWKRFKDPSGSYYYFNTRTKVSTKEKPKDFGSQQGIREELRVPLFCFQLLNRWNLVICKDGSKFYFNDDTKVSQLMLMDDDSQSLLDKVDQSLLALLIGVARGFSLNNDRDVYEEVSDTLKELSIRVADDGQIDAANDEGTIAVAGTDEELKPRTEVKNALIAGYSSSSDDSSDESENNTASVPGTLDEKDTEFRTDGDKSASEFIDLLNEYKFDPYSTWNIQAKRIMHDPRYYSISSDDKRDELFQTWCSQQIDNLNDKETDDVSDPNEVSEDLDSEDNLNPTKYHYLAHIISKSNITAETLFSDIKKENKSLFKELNIKENLSKKEQDQFASKVIAYYKLGNPLAPT